MLLRFKTKRLCLARLAALSATREQKTGAVLWKPTGKQCFTDINLSSSSLYCSDACRTADSLSHSPAYPPSTGSRAVSRTHHRGDPTQVELFYQDIPELDISSSFASTSVRTNKSRSCTGKSLSSTAASSQSSSPVSAPSVDDDEGSIPRSSDLMPPKTHYGVLSAKHAGHGNRASPSVVPEATISPSLRPMLRYSRRAYSTNVRAHDMANRKHFRSPSGNLLDTARPAPVSAPSSAATSPMLLPHTPAASTMDTGTIQSRKKNRRSLPLSLATLTVRDVNDPSAPTRGLQDTLAPQLLLNLAPASTLASGGHHHQKKVITPSHILGGHPSDWHPQLYSELSNSNHSIGVESGNLTNVDGSSSEGRERVTSTGTIKRPPHLKSKLAGNVKHDGHLGRLISPSAAVSTPSVVSVSGSILNDHAPPDALRATAPAPEQSQNLRCSPILPKPHTIYNPNNDAFKSGRGRSPRRSASAGTRNIADPIYQPTFSSSSRSSASPMRTSSRGPGRLSTKENEPATPPMNHHLSRPTGRDDPTSPSRRRASTSAQLRHSIMKTFHKPGETESSGSPSLSPVSSSESASGSSSAYENRPAQPMRVRRQTDGHPQRFNEREYARGRLELNGGERHTRGQSRLLPESRLLMIQGDERRGRSLLR